MSNPALKIVGGQLRDPAGSRVLLRGVNAQGIADVAAFFPGGIKAYLAKMVAKDATGNQWFTRLVRLPFERFPCTDQNRLYQPGDPRIPFCIPNTNAVSPWVSSEKLSPGTIRSFGGIQYMTVVRGWRADKGQGWNPGPFVPGDVVAGLPGNTSLYLCTASTTVIDPTKLNQAWDKGPQGINTAPQTDVLGNTWVYIGEYGQAGASEPFGGPVLFDGIGANIYFKGWQDGLVAWEAIESDLTPAQDEAAFASWTANVLDPAVQACVDEGLYALVCMFDFGPANHPLLQARLLDFWGRISKGKWANHPNVIFDLWNESESVGSFDGFSPDSWAAQKPVVQSVVDLIRSNGANNLVLVTTPAYCAYTDAATSSPLTGSNIMYAAHHYSQFFYSDWASHTLGAGGNYVNLEKALASGQAVMLSEWGPSNWDDKQGGMPTPDVAPFIATLKAIIESAAAHSVAGWAAWSWSPDWSPDLMLDGADSQPTVFGVATRQWLADMQNDSQPGGAVTTTPPPVPTVTTQTPIIDSISVPVNPGDPVIVTGHLAPPIVVVVPPSPPPVVTPPPTKSPAQIAAAAILAAAQADLSAAQGKVAQAQLIVDALG